MTLSRRAAVKLGLGAGAAPLLGALPLASGAAPATRHDLESTRLRARPLPLSDVRLTGGPLAHAQELNARYLLALEPDRMLAFYRERAGLRPKAEPYGGWDGDGRNLTGHIAGHYLSAVSLMWAATGDTRFKERADAIVSELREVQDAHGDGYLVALEGGRRAFAELARGEIRSAAFDLNGEWSPWYTLHKTYAGLRDAYRHAGSGLALEVETRFAAWAERMLASLSDAQLQQMLNTEFGGMNEVMVDLYADTGDGRWLALADRFEHREFIDPLKRHQDNLAAKHGNTQVPKLIGSADRFAYTGDAGDFAAASFFWDRVVQHHSFATGGHGTDEYFGTPDRLSDRVDGRTAETCNVYNMLKLTRRLFALRPDAHYADFHERALFNHVLASIDPRDGRTCYMVPVGRGVSREYQEMMESFTCCVGTGMESHALHGDGLYFESEDRLWVNLYAPSLAEWKSAGVRLEMETGFPEGETATITVTAGSPRALTLALRRPWWAGQGFSVRVNGEPVTLRGDEEEREPGAHLYAWPDPVSSWVEVARTWGSGDRVEIALPKTLRAEPLPDDPRRRALLWGPLVLAGDLGPEPDRAEGGALRAAVGAGRGQRRAGRVLARAGGGFPRPLQDPGRGPGARSRRPRPGRGASALLPPAPAHLLRVLGRLHPRRMGGASGAVRGRGGGRTPARGGHGRLPAARRDRIRAPLRLRGRSRLDAAADPRPSGPAREELVLLRPAGGEGEPDGAARDLLQRRPARHSGRLRRPGGRRARGRAACGPLRAATLLRRGDPDPSRARRRQGARDRALRSAPGEPDRHRVRAAHGPCGRGTLGARERRGRR